jgi:hypothetical protein
MVAVKSNQGILCLYYQCPSPPLKTWSSLGEDCNFRLRDFLVQGCQTVSSGQ